MTDSFDALSDDQVADEIATWAGRVAAGEARLLALIVEFDRRKGWERQGFTSLARWLSWRLGLAPGAARERARTARALVGLPLVVEAMGRGELSYTQVRAISRVAVPDDEQEWIGMARSASGGQLEVLVRGVRRARKPAEDEADPGLARWTMRSQVRYDDDGTMVLTVKLPAEQGAILLAAMDATREQLDRERNATDRSRGNVSGFSQRGRRSRGNVSAAVAAAVAGRGLVDGRAGQHRAGTGSDGREHPRRRACQVLCVRA